MTRNFKFSSIIVLNITIQNSYLQIMTDRMLWNIMLFPIKLHLNTRSDHKINIPKTLTIYLSLKHLVRN